ncbi:hypothetical protein [Desnuesiella massiliensis]|uniref:hypothetical protein n=1 Tax=Desnuesiella massiliensis TaxID=1650662 RepID=UPI0006E36178|nr:hypothetical protein [Desnuesiella massiliensis]
MKKTEKSENFTSNDDKIDWSKQYEVVEKIGVKGYLQRHFEECKHIWRNMVPKSGQANNPQGEMLRMAEKLRNEALDNGNINWDDNFEWFCDFLKEKLASCGLFDETKNMRIKMILDYIKDNGNYARKYANGEITDDQVDICKLAYTDDDIYDYLEDAIAEYYLVHKAPISYEIKEFIYR